MSDEYSAYFWYTKPDRAPALAQSGCQALYVKAFGDGSGHVWAQWSAAALAPFTAQKITPIPWGFILRQWQTDVTQIPAVLSACDAPALVLNVEIGEGGWDGATAEEAQALVAAVRRAAPGKRIGFSSCPSWDGDPVRGAPFFPYEAFAAACDFSMPQQYWTGAPDQVAYEVKRNRTGKPVIPILWGEWDDATLAQQSQHCRDVLGAQFGGLSAWEAGNDGYNITGMGAVYGALAAAEVIVTTNDNPGFPAAIGPQGNLVVNGVDFGGSDIVTVEVAQFQVLNSKNERYHIGWSAYQITPWATGALGDAPSLPPVPPSPPAPTPVPAPAPAPTPPPVTTGGTMLYTDHGPIPLADPDPHAASFVDPVSEHAGIVYVDVQQDHAFAVWSEASGWQPKQAYSDVLAGRWLLAWSVIIHAGHLKAAVTTSAAGDAASDKRAGFVDLGPVSAL